MRGLQTSSVRGWSIWFMFFLFMVLWASATTFAASARLTEVTVSGPSMVDESSTATYQATAKYSDGTSADVTASARWSTNSSSASFNSAGVLTTFPVNADTSIAVSATYVVSKTTKSGTLQVTIVNAPPPPPAPQVRDHTGRFDSYQYSLTCNACHLSQAKAVHGSVHFQFKGAALDVVNRESELEGKLGSINDYCIYPDKNWIGTLTTSDGTKTYSSGCGRCHVGSGITPSETQTQEQLDNIDCLVCHAPGYKRKVETVSINNVTTLRFVADVEAMGGKTALEAARSIIKPTRAECLACHSRGAGGNNYKRGDIEDAHKNPSSRNFDVHMAESAVGGAGYNCTDCHSFTGHKVAGRGSDLKPRESTVTVECSKCHTSTPHGTQDIDKHTARVNCTVCHIPFFAKIAPTDMERDWNVAEPDLISIGLFEPGMIKKSNVVPEYRFWNGTSRFYNFGTPTTPVNGRVMMSEPVGDISTPGAKIHAFKHHLSNQPIEQPIEDGGARRLLPVKNGIFFMRGNTPEGRAEAVQKGVESVGWTPEGVPFPFTYQATERYQGLFHEVSPKEQALQCSSCHETATPRLPLKQLGYVAKEPVKTLCSTCHRLKDYTSVGFTRVHDRHVTGRGYDCSACHGFTKAAGS